MRGQLAIALGNEKKAQEELEVLKEEMNAERASVQATRVIEKQKRELAVNKQIEDFNKSKEALDKRIDSLAAAVGQLPKVQVEIAGRKLGKNNKNIHFLCFASHGNNEFSLPGHVEEMLKLHLAFPTCSQYERHNNYSLCVTRFSDTVQNYEIKSLNTY